MSMSHVQTITDFELQTGTQALKHLIDLSGYWSRRWKEHLCRPKIKEQRSLCLKCLGQKKELLFPRTGLPNRHFLHLLLETCHGGLACNGYPFSLTRLAVHNYSQFVKHYCQHELDTGIDLIVSSIHRQMEEGCDVLIQYDESSFYLVSFKSSVSRITKLVDDIHKGLTGLTIPYPGGGESDKVKLDTGIALFKSSEAIESWPVFVQLSDLALLWSRDGGRPQIAVYE